MKNSSRISYHRGFTLIETVIAMGIITIMITGFLAAFGPAVQGIKKSISSKEANRLAGALENELSIVRPGESFTSAFDKAYQWIENNTANDLHILLYQYKGDPSSVATDGTLDPYTDKTTQLPGTDYVLQSVVRRLNVNDAVIATELQPQIVEGHVFYAKLTQLVYDGGDLKVAGEDGAPGAYGDIIDPTPDSSGSRDAVTGAVDFPEAVLLFRAEFYLLKSNQFNAVSNADLRKLGKPVFTRNMAVRR